jgi:hypothetical protein
MHRDHASGWSISGSAGTGWLTGISATVDQTVDDLLDEMEQHPLCY